MPGNPLSRPEFNPDGSNSFAGSPLASQQTIQGPSGGGGGGGGQSPWWAGTSTYGRLGLHALNPQLAAMEGQGYPGYPGGEYSQGGVAGGAMPAMGAPGVMMPSRARSMMMGAGMTSLFPGGPSSPIPGKDGSWAMPSLTDPGRPAPNGNMPYGTGHMENREGRWVPVPDVAPPSQGWTVSRSPMLTTGSAITYDSNGDPSVQFSPRNPVLNKEGAAITTAPGQTVMPSPLVPSQIGVNNSKATANTAQAGMLNSRAALLNSQLPIAPSVVNRNNSAAGEYDARAHSLLNPPAKSASDEWAPVPAANHPGAPTQMINRRTGEVRTIGASSQVPAGKAIPLAKAAQYLQAAGGDKTKAQKMATADGFDPSLPFSQ